MTISDAGNSVFAQPETSTSGGTERREERALKFFLALAIFINITKVLLGSRFFALIADAATLSFFLYCLYNHWARRVGYNPLEKWVLIFMATGVVTIFHPNTPDITVGMEGYRKWVFQMLGFFIGFHVLRNRRTLFSVVQFLVILSVPILLYSIKQFFHMSAFDEKLMESNTADILTYTIFDRLRAFGIFNGPFHLGLYGGFVFWFSLGMFRETGRKVYLSVSVLAVCAILVSLTRSSMVALAASSAIIYLFFMKEKRLTAFLSVVFLSAILYMFIEPYMAELTEVGQALETVSDWENLSTDSRLGNRLDAYENAVGVVLRAPFGYGMGSAGDAMERYYEPINHFHMTSHNMFLKAAIEFGWFGPLVFLYIFIRLVILNWKLRNKDQSASIIFAGITLIILITGLTGSTVDAYPVNLIFWIMMGSLVSLASETT